MASAKVNGFPPRLFVKRENIGTEDEYYASNEDMNTLVDDGNDVVVVAEYHLVATKAFKREVVEVKSK